MGIVVDTSALIDLERADQELALESEEATDIFVPTLVLAELLVGVELATSRAVRERRARKVQGLLRVTSLLPFSADLAPTYARLYAELRRNGTTVPANDLAVAASALHYGHVLVVGRNDEAHFRRVPGLRVRRLGS